MAIALNAVELVEKGILYFLFLIIISHPNWCHFDQNHQS